MTWVWPQFWDKNNITEPKSVCMNFLKKCLSLHWTDWLQKLIPPDQQTNKTVWWWYATHISYYGKCLCCWSTRIESRRPTWHPHNNTSNIQRNWYFATEMTSSLIVIKVSFTGWKIQNLFVQIWTSITLNPVDRTRINSQEN